VICRAYELPAEVEPQVSFAEYVRTMQEGMGRIQDHESGEDD
jgi:hypothetical protein